jgi:glycerol kinase
MKNYFLVFDCGTTCVKTLIFDKNLKFIDMSSRKVQSLYPGAGLVEQDPLKIYSLLLETAREVMKKNSLTAADFAAAGIGAQRTSWLFWDTDQNPICNLITWQDTRGAGILKRLFTENEKFNAVFPGVAPYLIPLYTPVAVAATKEFSAEFAENLSKDGIKWGNLDTFLLYKLTGGKQFATTLSMASNSTMLDNQSCEWNTYIPQYVGMRPEMFPEIRDESADFGVISEEIFGGEIPIYGMIADQQAAMFAHGCFDPTVAKCTNGSGTFVNVNIGSEYKTFGGFYTSVAWRLKGKVSYMFEGNSYTAGSCLEWAQRQLELYGSIKQLDEDAASVEDSNGVYFVPALGGMSGAPYNDPTARASFMGIGPDANRKHFVRAVLDAIAFAASDVLLSFQKLGVDMKKLSVSGGVSNSDIAVQLISNILNAEVSRAESIEATGFGIAALAALYMNITDEETIKKGMPAHKIFTPDKNQTANQSQFKMWKKALDRSLKWLE